MFGGSPLKGGSLEDGQSPSPCPSPTPLFHQLYAAVAHWERVLAGSPELLKEVLGKYSPDLADGGGEGPGLDLRKKTASMHNLSVNGMDTMQRELSLRRRSSPGGMWLAAAAGAAAKKKSEMNPQ